MTGECSIWGAAASCGAARAGGAGVAAAALRLSGVALASRSIPAFAEHFIGPGLGLATVFHRLHAGVVTRPKVFNAGYVESCGHGRRKHSGDQPVRIVHHRIPFSALHRVMALQFPPLAFHRGSIIELGWNFSSRRPKVGPTHIQGRAALLGRSPLYQILRIVSDDGQKVCEPEMPQCQMQKNMKAGGRHKPSINARIFMVRAPRERPMACAGSPLFRLRHSDAALPPSNRSAPAFGLPAEARRGISVQTLMAAQRMKSLWSVLRGPKTGPSRSARKHRSSCRYPSWKS